MIPILRKIPVLICLAMLLGPLRGTASTPDKDFSVGWGFLENQGQWPENALFRVSASGFSIQFQHDGVLFMSAREAEDEHSERSEGEGNEQQAYSPEEGEMQDIYVWKMRFVNAVHVAEVLPLGVVAARTNYFIGDDPAKWRTKVPEYRELIYEEVWPGIDVRFFLTENGSLKYEFVLAPGADPDQIRIGFEGLDGIEVLESGEMQLNHPWGPVTEDVPVAFAEAEHRDVPVKFVKTGKSEYGFDVEDIPQGEEWVIDPLILYWSTFAFSSQPGAYYSNDVAYDQTGHLYMTGTTGYAFPSTPGAYQTMFGGSSTDAYVAKFSPDGSTLVFMTFLGGSSGDISNSIALNASGRIFICGRTGSPNFPISPGAFFNNTSTLYVPFAASFSGDGSTLFYSTNFCQACLGNANGLATVSNDEVVIAGEYTTNTSSPFPTTPGAFMPVSQGLSEGWVLRLNGTGSALVWSTMLGGSDDDYLYDVAVNDLEEPYVVGKSSSTAFPITPGAFLSSSGASLIARLNANGTGLIYSSWFGPDGDLRGVDVHPVSREAFVVGTVNSAAFTTTPGAFQTVGAGGTDVAVGRVNASGSTLIYSTYLGGNDADDGRGIAVNENNEAYVSGFTNSSNFPFTNCQYQTTPGGNRDVFLAHFSPLGDTLGSAGIAIFGGQNNDYTNPRVEVREDGPVDTLFYGLTSHSPDFPTTPGTYAPVKGNGTSDLQVAMKLVPAGISLPDTSYCNSDSIEIQVASLFDNLLWSTSDTTPGIWINQPGQYWVQGTIYGCTFSDTFNITAALLSVNLGADTTVCDTTGLSVTLNAGSGNAWQWSTSATSSGITATQPGTYWVEVTDTLSGCRVSDTLAIIPGQLPLPNLPPIANFCQGDSIALDADPGNNYPGASFLWSNADTSSQTTFQNPGWAWVEITGPDGCTRRDSSLVVLNSPPSVSLGADSTLCDTTGFNATASGPNFASWLWSNGSTNPSTTFFQAGTVWVQVTDSNGCVARDSLQLTLGYAPSPDLGPDQYICPGDSVTLHADPNNQAPGASFLWHNGATTAQTTLSTGGWAWVEQTTSAGCRSIDSIRITLHALPNPDLGPDTSVCGAPSVFLDAGPAFSSYLWSDGSTGPTTNILSSGWAWVEVTDINGCTNRDSLHITTSPFPSPVLPPDTLLCDQDSILLNPGSFSDYLWSDGSTAPSLNVATPGLYSVTVSNGSACLDSASIVVTQLLRTHPELGPDLNLCHDDPRMLALPQVPDTEVEWSTGSREWQIDILRPGIYWAEITDQCGKMRDSVQVNFAMDSTDIFVPNVFSPNYDGINDCWKVEIRDGATIMVQIYDRWGRLMYELPNPTDCWDGHFANRPAPEGVYFVLVRYRACNGELVNRASALTLVR